MVNKRTLILGVMALSFVVAFFGMPNNYFGNVMNTWAQDTYEIREILEPLTDLVIDPETAPEGRYLNTVTATTYLGALPNITGGTKARVAYLDGFVTYTTSFPDSCALYSVYRVTDIGSIVLLPSFCNGNTLYLTTVGDGHYVFVRFPNTTVKDSAPLQGASLITEGA